MAQSDLRKSAAAKLREQFLIGPTPENQPISRGMPIERQSNEVYRTYGESMSAALDQGLNGTATMDVLSAGLSSLVEERDRAANRAKLSPLEANQLYPYMQKPFIESVDPGVAKLLADRQLENIELQGVVDAANQGSLAKLGRFSLQLGVGVFDPLNYVTGRGIGSAVGWAAGRFNIGRGILNASTPAGQFGRDALLGAVGNTVAEPLNAGFRSQFQEEYDPLSSLAYQSMLGIGIQTFPHIYRGAVGFASPRLKALMGSASKADAVAANSAIAKMDAGKSVDSARVVQDVLRERTPAPFDATAPKGSPRNPDTSIHGQPVDYRYTPITESSHYSERPFYQATELQNSRLENSSGQVVGRDVGPGMYLTDNPIEANAVAGSKYSHEGAGVFEVALTKKDMQMIDLNHPFPKMAQDILETHAESWSQGQAGLGDLQGKPAGQIMDTIQDAIAEKRIPENAVSELNKSLAAAGFDGYRFDNGGGDAKSNGVMLFDNGTGKVEETSRFAPDESVIPSADPAELQAAIDDLNSIRSDALYERADHDRMTDLISNPAEVQKLSDVEKSYQDTNAEIQQAKSRGEIDNDLEAQLAAIDEDLKIQEQQDSIVKAAFACMSRNE